MSKGTELVVSEFHDHEVFFQGQASIGVSEAGEIRTKKLNPYLNSKDLQVPVNLIELIGKGSPSAERYRRGIAIKMIQNSPNSNPIIGKPSSAFIIRTKQSYFIDFLIEKPEHKRDPNRTLHSYMTEYDNKTHADRYHPANLLNRVSMWSGHVAILTPQYCVGDYCYMFLFDKFERISASLGSDDVRMINTIHSNRIVPITADGHIIERNMRK